MEKYYTDPLAAAYMARELGVVYATKSKIDAWSDRETPTIISEAGMHNGPHELYRVISNEIDKNNAVYIHEDSLPIFKPQDGDRNINGMVYENGAWVGLGYALPAAILKENNYDIDKRDGKQFFTPQEE